MSHKANKLTFEYLSPQHSVGAFSCGKEIDDLSINQYLSSGEALNDQLLGISCTTLAFYEDVLAGYYTARCTELSISEAERQELNKKNTMVVSALEVTVFAVAESLQKQGIGSAMLDRIITDTINLTKWVGCKYIFVHALPRAESWYLKKEFMRTDLDFFDGNIAMRLPIPSYHFMLKEGFLE